MHLEQLIKQLIASLDANTKALKQQSFATPVAEQPKAEQPKAEQPKAEQPKAEQPKAEQPKAEQPKVTLEQLQSAAQKLITSQGTSVLREVLDEHGVGRLSTADTKLYPSLLEAITTRA